MASRKKERMRLHERDGFAVMDLGAIEIWDGADLALLRETLTRLVTRERRRAVGVDMSSVKYIPSGFFGMLYDCFERGVAIRLYHPQPNVANMLWFRRFFLHEGRGCFRLCPDERRSQVPAAAAVNDQPVRTGARAEQDSAFPLLRASELDWDAEDCWEDEDASEPVAVFDGE